MRLQGTWVNLITWRSFTSAESGFDASVRRLSSGQRINTAGDDAAGLAISQNLLGQYRGLVQANRNAMDGISLVNTAESALQEVSALLQRGRELALQAANGTLQSSDRQKLQEEFNQLLDDLDRTADQTEWNGKKLFNSGANSGTIARVVTGLRSGWLEQAENLVRTQYGIDGDGSELKIVLENGGTQDAWLTGNPGINGVLDNLQLHINTKSITGVGGPDGGLGPIYDDRKVARAVTQAILARNSDYVTLSSWFSSGAADFIAGRNEQLKADIDQYGASAVINALAGPWADDSRHESAAYLAVKYLASRLGPFFSMQDIFAELKGGNSLGTALLNTLGIDETQFINDFLDSGAGGGLAFLSTLDLTGPDVGGIGTGDASSVIPNGGAYTPTPMSPKFSVSIATTETRPLSLQLQIGANASDTLNISIPYISTFSLNLLGLDVVSKATEAIGSVSNAIQTISSVRAQLGATSNRLEFAINSNNNAAENQLRSYSRIVDVDFAQELTHQTRQQVLMSSTSAMLAQANTARQHILWLLKGSSGSPGAPAPAV